MWEKILKEQTRPKPSPLPDWFLNTPDEKGFGSKEVNIAEKQGDSRASEILNEITEDLRRNKRRLNNTPFDKYLHPIEAEHIAEGNRTLGLAIELLMKAQR